MQVSNQIKPKFSVGQRLIDKEHRKLNYIVRLIYLDKKTNNILYEIEMRYSCFYKLHLESLGILPASVGEGKSFKVSEKNLSNLVYLK